MGKYYKKYFKVESKEESFKLQQFLFNNGYITNGNKTDLCDWGDEYPIFIGTDYVAEGRFGWAELESFYSDQEEYEFMDLPWKVEEKSYTESKDHIVSGSVYYIDQAKLEDVLPLVKNTDLQWTDKHYNFNVDVSGKDTLKVDPYFVSKTWKIGSKDESGALFHILKTISRFGSKNTREREIKAIYKQIVRLAELEGVELNEERQ